MTTVFNDLVALIGEVPVIWAYGILLLAAYLENVFPPVPGDVCIIFAGYLAAAGSLNLPLVIALGTASGILGFMTVFYVGRTAGHRLVDSRRFRWIDKNALATVERWAARWGAGVVLLNRFLAAVRSVVALSVGMGGMESKRALVLCAVAALAWTSLLAWAGYVTGENWERILGLLSEYSRIVLIVIAVIIGVAFWRYMQAKKRASSGE